MDRIGRTFDAALCCEHEWQKREGRDEQCAACGSNCTRDRDGKIIAYSRGDKDVPKAERNAVEAAA